MARPYEEGYTEKPYCGEAQASLGRPTGREELANVIEELRFKAKQFQGLLDALPSKLPPDADGALWALACKARREPL